MAGSTPASPTADGLAPPPPGKRARSNSPWAAVGRRLWRVPINDIDFTARLAGPSLKHPFGTDDLGQDLLARMLYGGRISLAVGLAAMIIAIVVGIVIGAIAGISRGSVDAALMW